MIDETLIIFYNFISLSVPYQEIGSIRKEMLEGLQGSCVSDIGNLTKLKTVATLLDSFLKKLIVLTKIDSFSSVSNLQQMALLKKVGCWGNTIPNFNPNTIESYKGNSDASYILGVALMTRNNVHQSPSWDDSEVTHRLKYVISLYIFLICKFKQQLLLHEPGLSKSDLNYFDENPESALLFDYISYGRTTIEIRKRILFTYTKHLLFHEGIIEEVDLIKRMICFSQNTLTEKAAKRRLDELVKDSIKIETHFPVRYSLKEEEKARIDDAKEQYNLSIHAYNNSLNEVIVKYGLNAPYEHLSEALMDFLRSQYNFDIQEALSEAGDASDASYNALLFKLQQFGCPPNKTRDCYKDLLSICKDNDIALRISAGKAFQKLSDPDLFNKYIRKAERAVWIDTQILLYLMCYNADYSVYDNPQYKTALALFRQPITNNYFHFKVAQFYVNEICYHLRQALLLIKVVDLPFASSVKWSKNVFYRHYRYLRENDGLPDNIESFSDYMEDNFNLTEEDAFEPDYSFIAKGIVEDKLEEFNIEIIKLATEDSQEIRISEKLFEEITKQDGYFVKSGLPLANDSWMGAFLFRNQDSQKPIFVTSDKSFEQYRRSYIEKYRRGRSFTWHLMSPSKMVNHIDFMDFKINSDNFTDDMMCMVETDEVKDKTMNIIDRFNRFLDIPHLTSGQRKKYIDWVSELFQSDEFSFQPDIVNEANIPNEVIRFLDAQDSVFNYFYEKGKSEFSQFQNMLSNELGFSEYLEELKDYAISNRMDFSELHQLVENIVNELIHSLQEQ